MRTIAVINQKGGVGKTTLCLNLGAALAKKGQKVLLVDLDPQAHLTYSLGLDAHELDQTLYQLLQGTVPRSEAMLRAGQLEVIPSSLDLAGAEMEFAALPGREFLLKDALKGLRGRDFVFLDCPPNLGLLTVNALAAAREVLIPMQTEFLAMQSLAKLMETIEVIKRRLNPKLRVAGIVGTRHSPYKRLNREVLSKVGEHLGDLLFTTVIRDNVSVAEAPSFGKDIFSYKPRSYGAEDYKALAAELLQRG